MKVKFPFRFCIWTALTMVAMVTVLFVTETSGYVTSKVLSPEVGITSQKWAAFPITWRMNPVVGGNVTGTREQGEVIRESFQSWSAIPTASITFVEGSPTSPSVLPAFDQVNLVTSNVTPSIYGSGALGLTLVYSFETGGGFDEFGRPIQFAGQIVEADIMLNPQEAFTTNTTLVPDRTDLQSVMTHEIGHLLGMDHTTLISSTMFPSLGQGFNYPKVISTDDAAGVSTIYPAPVFATKGTLSGTVRTTTNTAVYGAIVVAVNASGQPVASALTNPNGQYTIAGLEPGPYTLYAEPLDQPVTIGNLNTLSRIYPGTPALTNFTTRFR